MEVSHYKNVSDHLGSRNQELEQHNLVNCNESIFHDWISVAVDITHKKKRANQTLWASKMRKHSIAYDVIMQKKNTKNKNQTEIWSGLHMQLSICKRWRNLLIYSAGVQSAHSRLWKASKT